MADATPLDDPNPFVRYGPRLAWWAFAGAHGLTVDERVALTREVDDAMAEGPPERLVLRAGRVVARTTAATELALSSTMPTGRRPT